MRSVLLFFLSLMICTFSFAQETVKLTANMTDCGSEIGVFAFQAMDLSPIDKVKATQPNKFEFTLKTEAPRLIYIGKAPNKVVPLMVGPDKEIEISASCRNTQRATISNSPFNGQYIEMQNKIKKLKRENNILMTKQVRAKTPEEKKAAIASLKELDEQRKKYLDTLKSTEPYLAKILALNTYLSFVHNKGNYQNELEYFGNEFFRFVDFNDNDYNTLPLVFDAFYDYTRTILSVGRLPKEITTGFINRSLSLIPAEQEGARQLALGGVIRALERQKSDLYGVYAQKFIKENEKELPQLTARVKRKYEQLTMFEVGRIAPDFSQQTPEGEDFKLSDMRGKYVLIDFWASWCGPCRRENPNVVKVYNRYKDKGFDILGVSLDKDKTRWLAAIEKDQLTWKHVSDLKGWSNAVAKQYGISSIPRTMLIDPEGKIIAKNLRGAALYQKLAALFDDTSGEDR